MEKIWKKSADNHLENVSRNCSDGDELKSMCFEKRYVADPVHFQRMTSEEIRDNFLLKDLFTDRKSVV